MKIDNKDNHKKVGINARNGKAKYSDDEIARARYVDSKSNLLRILEEIRGFDRDRR